MTIDMSGVNFYQPLPTLEPPLEALTEAQRRAYRIFARRSQSRIDWYGGYHDVCCFLDNLIIIATLYNGKEPDLVIEDVEDYIGKLEEEIDDG